MGQTNETRSARVSRRRFLGGTLVAGLAVGLVEACAPAAPPSPTVASKPAAATAAPAAPAAAPAKPTVAPAAPPSAPAAAAPTATAATPAAAAKPAVKGKPGGSLKLGVKVDVATFYPPHMAAYATWQLAVNVYHTLYTMGDGTQNQLDPLVESLDMSKDFKTWQFKIKKGIQWHDGKELTAADFAYFVAQVLDPKSGSYLPGWYPRVESAEAPDKYTLIVKCSKPNATLDTSIIAITGAPTRQDLGEKMATNPVGVGPYQVVERVANTSTKLKKNPNYYVSGLPLIDEITYKVIPEESSKVAALLAGDVDWIDTVPLQSVAQLKADKSVVYVETPSSWVDYLWIPCDKKPFDDQRVRNALEYAMDRDALVKGVSLGLYKPWYSMIGEFSTLKIDTPGLKYDLDKAKFLMKEAGYADGFKMKFVPAPTYPETLRVAEILKEQWKKINVDLEIWIVDPGQRTAVLNGREWGAWWNARPHGYDPQERLYAYFRSDASYNYPRWKDPKVDELLDLAMETRDPGKRTEYYGEANKLIVNSSSNPALFQRIALNAMRPWVKNYQIRHDSLPFWDEVSIDK